MFNTPSDISSIRYLNAVNQSASRWVSKAELERDSNESPGRDPQEPAINLKGLEVDAKLTFIISKG
jgi:hypothetical protein